MVTVGCPETSVIKYHYSLRNNPEERSSRLLRGVSLKSSSAPFVKNDEIFLPYVDVTYCKTFNKQTTNN
jgi:hypothetical protein